MTSNWQSPVSVCRCKRCIEQHCSALLLPWMQTCATMSDSEVRLEDKSFEVGTDFSLWQRPTTCSALPVKSIVISGSQKRSSKALHNMVSLCPKINGTSEIFLLLEISKRKNRKQGKPQTPRITHNSTCYTSIPSVH